MNSMLLTRFSYKVTLTGAASLTMAATLLCGSASVTAATLPVPCTSASCAPNKTPGFTAPAGFVTSGQATATQSGNTLTVSQTSGQAILNWSSFNVSADGKVVFQQPAATSIALNKIYQASPSSIFGQITANGQIYLINPNGFVFGATSSVNVAGLIASSLGLAGGDTEFTSGILTPGQQTPATPAFASDGRVYVSDANGNPVPDSQGNNQPVQIVVQPGAQMTAADGGRLMLAGQNVVNGGSLTAPDGQIVLAAGQSVYLAAAPTSEPWLRGLVVEVAGNTPSTTSAPAQTGNVTNQAGAVLSAARGNISLIGLAVNQDGRISATTSVSSNGSVILLAANGSGGSCQTGEVICATQGGTLKIGSTSEIDVLPDLSTADTAVVGQSQIPSTIQLTGQQVDLEGGTITAPGGTLKVLAAANPDAGLATNGNTAAQIQVDAGTNINLSGSDAVVPMSANLVSIQLRSNELEDDPQQRGGALEGQTVIVDVRNGKPAIISTQSWDSDLEGIQENILQRTSVGGTASFLSEGDVVVNRGATINVSGGQWNYSSGVVQTSQLIGANGQTYNIGTASPSLAYTGVLNPTYTQAYNGFGVQVTEATPGLGHTESGYVQGFSAGSVTIAAPSLAMEGTLIGNAVNGIYQRTAAPADSLIGLMSLPANGFIPANNFVTPNGIATGGTLVIGESSPLITASGAPDFFSPGVVFSNNVAPVVVAEGAPYTQQTLELPVSYITSGGFSQTQIYSDSTVTLPSGLPLNLGAGGLLQIVAPRINIDSSIQALGGTIDLGNTATAASVAGGLPRLGIDIGSGVTLDVRGQWTNDSQNAPSGAIAPAYQNGGTIDLSLFTPFAYDPSATFGGELVLGNNVTLEASGGAWFQATNTLVGGTGGTISLEASPYQSALQVGTNVSLSASGVQGAMGGTFSLAAPRIAVSQGTGTWATVQDVDDLTNPGGVFNVGAALFSQDGFSNVTLTATAPVLASATSNDVLTVESGTNINAQAESLELSTGYLTRQSGGTIQAFSQVKLLPEAERNPFTLALQVTPDGANFPSAGVIGDLDIQAGANITADPGSIIALYGQGSILVNGVLRAPGGTISAWVDTPDTQVDPGYLPNQRIELGAQAVLDVSGTTVLTPNTLNLPLGNVLAGGSVDLVALRGDVIADAGSSIDIQGASSVLDVQTIGGSGGYQRTTVGSAGGKLSVESVESISLLGNVSAAGGASSTGTLAGGTLSVDLDPLAFTPAGVSLHANNPLPTTPATIELVSSTAGSTPTASYGDLAVLGVEQLAQWGIDTLQLKSDSIISLDTSTALSLGREITLDAPTITVSYGTNATLIAPYVAISDSNTKQTSVPTALTGTGALNVSAQQIVMSGVVALQGVANATFMSSGDIEFEPQSTDELAGTLEVAGNLNLNAARIYPATQTSFTITDSSPTGTVSFGQTTASPGVPLSVAGSLTVDATNISSSGTILAPFGQITLDATNSLSLLNGSVTSVSADGAVLPYGQTVLGQTQWVYDGNIPVGGVPMRQVSLTAPNVSFASGATIDVSGGGDLSAYEWVPGTGGSVDALGQANASTAGLYAVLPSTRGQYASYDIEEFNGSNVTAGESVYLSGIAGLPAGVYPLLPARYALLPGAFLIQAEPGYTSLAPGTIGTLTTGAPVVAGYLSFGVTGLRDSSGYTGFAVYPGSYGQSLAQYTISDASTYFANAATSAGNTQVPLPADAGTLLIAAGSTLNALGKVDSAGGSGGTAATIELSATDLTVTATAQTASSGVSVSAPVLTSWAAGDLILGGNISADGSSLTVAADNVTIGQGAVFSAGQVIAVANQSVEVQSGATVASNSGVSGTALKTPPTSTSLSLLNADGSSDSGAALLAVSDTSLPIVNRGAATTGGGTTQGGGTIRIDSGATLSTRGAVALDAPTSVLVSDGASINAPGASWSLASNSIAFVGAGASSSDTLTIDPALLSQMQTAGAIRLGSAGSIDLLTNVTLGASGTSTTPTLGALTLSAGSINNVSGGTSVFGGQTLTLENAGTAQSTPTSGSGSLTFVANTINIGRGSLAISGNSQTTLDASGAVVGQGTGTLAVSGNATISAAELTAQNISSTTTTAANPSNTTVSVPDGTLTILQSGTAVDPSTLTASLGGQLTLAANSIQDSGTIIVPGGRITLQAAPDPNAPAGGSSSPSDITLSSTAVVNASGITVTAGNANGGYVTVGAAGGIVNISATGELTLPSGAAISVSGAGDAPAGYLSLTGGGTVTLGANLAGNAAPGAIGGNFSLDAGSLVDAPGSTASGLSALAGTLTTGGFSNLINVEVQTGDLSLNTGTTLTANQISLTADTGSIDIAGTLSAPSAGLRGSIGLFAGNNVTLESTGSLLANGSGGTGRGGEIELSTDNGSITLDSGSVISASGTAQMGSLLLRAPAIVSSGDVAIGNIGSNVTNAGQIIIEPVLPTYVSTTDFTQNFSQIQNDLENYLNQDQALSVLQGRFGSKAIIEPGVVIEAQGDLNLSQTLDLYALQLGVPIDLTVRATGNITIDGTISDGISGSTLFTTPSSSLRFVAGANLNSANPLATAAGSDADLTLGTGALVRTGTGDIDLVASNDVVISAGASAYTVGTLGPTFNVKLGSTAQINLTTNGGNVIVDAGRDVVGYDTVNPSDAAAWQARNIVSSNGNPGQGEWGVNLAAFDNNPWSLATFGGGDLSITAGRDVLNVSAAAADSMAITGSTQTLFASGGLTVTAGRDVTSGQFLVDDGIGTLTAGRSFAANLSDNSGTAIGSVFELANSQISLWAEGDINIAAILNPTVLGQPKATGGVSGEGFFTYGENSSFSAQSTAGSVNMLEDTTGAELLLGQPASGDSIRDNWIILPASLSLVSMTQNLDLGQATLFPSDTGQLRLFAGQDINLGAISMSDAPDSVIPTAASITDITGSLIDAGDLVQDNSGPDYNFFSGRHVNDPTPASIVAGQDINNLVLNVPKAADIIAGRDIVGLQYNGQNLSPNDITLISVGRDFIDPPQYATTGLVDTAVLGVVSVGGPGQLDILAGRDINLGFSEGVITDGNLKNPNLPTSVGASVTMMAGLGQTVDYAGFLQSVIEPSATYQQQLVSYVESLTGQSNLSTTQADSEFAAFNADQQRSFIDQVFFSQLNTSGLDANKPGGGGYALGYAAIDALFPGARTAAAGIGSNPSVGDLSMTYSQVYTLSGGGISILVPGGDINVGLANPPSGSGVIKTPNQLGIVAQGLGDVDIYTEGDVNVNSSRIFTLGGGNIVIWSNAGNIDAGNGAKSSLSLPPPTTTIDSHGNEELVYNAAVAGSGIRTIQDGPDVPAGNVNLIAPVGSVNAGDAGIGAAGNINLSALVVTGASNINFGGTATGVPPAVANVTASVSSAASSASATSNAASALENSAANSNEAAPLAQTAISWLDVFVTGLGEENCKPEDTDCLNRQKKE
jgi:filamentous hemagglutinin